ncbi:LLM class F420-dependent oxidoreductase [Mycolicibacterium poriferae]|uniref:LLM class F420-dependent oxidoreductase n=1 Tax=Mycolicibacterium poriferae TaxID=39694 RepID=A0A6N4VG47_9MYCO|nr:TIGR03617 family F420-dependent LLM class oxidoreductase [Mycolicibacterium poriferae]MAS04709.1 LLM class F420-dependent oxidoreductase [Ahrensia sp.]MCV7262622.1 TIGR03617 family F420-dependent LLM class oxidoreductase [Mycolicibacterium poriferae]BBX53113.1 LLM class F420-dependent oxidoreductase [Mycolicibacterium poriferae]
MKIDTNIGGSIDGTGGGELGVLADQLRTAEKLGFDGVWSTEVSRDPFLPLLLAADRSSTLQIGTAVAVAFARSPMTTAAVSYDLNTFSNGRFVLGLGSQIRAHIERRFGMPWSAPAERMAEYIRALHAIWHSWETGEKLDFRGEHYHHTLMTPMFCPEPNPYGRPRVMVAAVGPKMTAVAAKMADGLLIHGFTTRRYLSEVTVPIVEAGLSERRWARDSFSTVYPGLVITGDTEERYARAVDQVRRQIAFYGATPAYRAVLDLHGWGDLHTEFHRLSRRGDWATMTGLIDDDVLDTFAVSGAPDAVGRRIVERFAGLVDRFTLYTPYPLDDLARAAIIEGVRAVR